MIIMFEPWLVSNRKALQRLMEADKHVFYKLMNVNAFWLRLREKNTALTILSFLFHSNCDHSFP